MSGTGASFGVALVVLVAVCGGVAAWAERRAVRERPPIELGDLAVLLVVPMVFAAVLAPKFLWESFNGDGAHAFESARLLLNQPTPFWPPDAGIEFMFASPRKRPRVWG